MSENSKYVIRSQKRKKYDVVERFGGQCQICGYNKCLNALELHHLDKTKKEYQPSYIIKSGSWKRIDKELENCILLCANCHREVHADEHTTNYDFKSYIKPFVEVTCDYCKTNFTTRKDTQIYCSHKCLSLSKRKIQRPSKEELEILVKTTSMVKIGKMFGVSDNAVRKWIKIYNRI